MGGGPPRFPPDTTCRAVLTCSVHRPHDPRRLRGSHPLRRPVPAAFGCASRDGEGSGAPSNRVVQPRHDSGACLVSPCRFGLFPVRSPLLRESSLFLGVLRCFSSPGSLPDRSPDPRVRPLGGCPIRTPLDRWLPAPPQGVSPRGRVLPRHPAPRHPPCAHHCGAPRCPSHVPAPDAAPPSPAAAPPRGFASHRQQAAPSFVFP